MTTPTEVPMLLNVSRFLPIAACADGDWELEKRATKKSVPCGEAFGI